MNNVNNIIIIVIQVDTNFYYDLLLSLPLLNTHYY